MNARRKEMASGNMRCDLRLASNDDAESISAVIVAALRETNSADYSPEIIERVEKSFSASAVREMIELRTVFVATRGTQIIGTASLDGQKLRTVFVSPSVHRNGIGSQLVARIEQLAHTRGIAVLTVSSSVTAKPFYSKIGFSVVRENLYGDERTIIMERRLLSPNAGNAASA